MKEALKCITRWFGDERSSVLSEKSLMVAVGIIGGVVLGGIALPKIKNYAETIYFSFEGAVDETGFTSSSP